ncbi:MAG: ribose 5-phosphate isomerase B [Chloroflexota bacterium]
MKVAIGCDHAGQSLKKEIITLLKEMSHKVEDFGCPETWPQDYPDVALSVAEAVASGNYDRGILICGTGIGMSITANKVRGIRAALCHDVFSAHSSREHNDANILCMGQRVIGVGAALDVVKSWMEATFSEEERHVRRVDKISAIECGAPPDTAI